MEKKRISGALIPSFPDSSVGKESAYNAVVPSLIPGLGKSPGEGTRYPLQYSVLENSMGCMTGQKLSHLVPWAFLVAQTIRILPAMWEAQVRSLGGEDPLEKGTATCSSILAWRIP